MRIKSHGIEGPSKSGFDGEFAQFPPVAPKLGKRNISRGMSVLLGVACFSLIGGSALAYFVTLTPDPQFVESGDTPTWNVEVGGCAATGTQAGCTVNGIGYDDGTGAGPTSCPTGTFGGNSGSATYTCTFQGNPLVGPDGTERTDTAIASITCTPGTAGCSSRGAPTDTVRENGSATLLVGEDASDFDDEVDDDADDGVEEDADVSPDQDDDAFTGGMGGGTDDAG